MVVGSKRKRITSLTKGSRHKFQQQHDPLAQKHFIDEPTFDVITDHEALAQINIMSNCCSRSNGVGCFAKIFMLHDSVNYNECIKHFKICREKMKFLSVFEKTKFVEELYKTSVSETGNRRNKMTYMLYEQQVCRMTMLTVYDLSKFFWDQCIQNMKLQGK
jgi:hypothetical protein